LIWEQISYKTGLHDKRVIGILLLEYRDTICVLRTYNKARPEKYILAWQERQIHIKSSLETAVHKRRHDKVDDESETVTHFADAILVRELYDQRVQKCTQTCNTTIPSN
jgi:hypothetical protein